MRALPLATLAALVADRMRRARSSGSRPASPAETATSVQRLLEEGGVSFSVAADLHDLKGYVIASQYGAEITVSDRLDAEQRLDLYAQLLAHALVGAVDTRPAAVLAPFWSVAFGDHISRNGLEGKFFAHLEYVAGRRPSVETEAERRNGSLVTILAEAILGGHLDVTPRYAFAPGGKPTAPGRGLRATVGRVFLDICHRTSLALYWRSTRYRRLRANRQVTGLAHQLDGIVRAYAPGIA